MIDQEEMRRLYPSLAAVKSPTSSKIGDGSRYGKMHVRGEMNKTEASFADRLEVHRMAGGVVSWSFEEHVMQLGPRATYRPDFRIVMHVGGEERIEFVDVKGAGPISDTSVVKIKWAAQKYPEFKFVIEQKLSKKQLQQMKNPPASGWKRREF